MRNKIMEHVLLLVIVASFLLSSCATGVIDLKDPVVMSELMNAAQGATYWVKGGSVIATGNSVWGHWAAQITAGRIETLGKVTAQEAAMIREAVSGSPGWMRVTWMALGKSLQDMITSRIYGTNPIRMGALNGLILLPAVTVEDIMRYTQPGMVVQ